MQTPHLHIGRVCSIADVDGIIEERAGEPTGAQLLANPLQPVGAHALEVRRGKAASGPFTLGQRAVADHMLVKGCCFFLGVAG